MFSLFYKFILGQLSLSLNLSISFFVIGLNKTQNTTIAKDKSINVSIFLV
tara:strand:- start:292 stop:441 length:150 start_codon:yes stop_codon:yes gene_type:complete